MTRLVAAALLVLTIAMTSAQGQTQPPLKTREATIAYIAEVASQVNGKFKYQYASDSLFEQALNEALALVDQLRVALKDNPYVRLTGFDVSVGFMEGSISLQFELIGDTAD